MCIYMCIYIYIYIVSRIVQELSCSDAHAHAHDSYSMYNALMLWIPFGDHPLNLERYRED